MTLYIQLAHLILKIKSIALVVLSFIGIIFSIIFICNGNQLIKDSEQITNDASGTIQCSSALSGGILKILGIILLFVAIIMLALCKKIPAKVVNIVAIFKGVYAIYTYFIKDIRRNN